MKPSVLRFVYRSTGNPVEVMSRFFPQGKTVLNSAAWRGKAPRTCGLTSVKSRPGRAGGDEPIVFDVEVTCRPKGCITFVNGTKFDGWTAMLLDRGKDGTLLDGRGNPLPEGQPPVYLPVEVYGDVDFNGLDLGEFLGESELEGIPRVAQEDVLKEIGESAQYSVSTRSTFMALRRHRPLVKIVLSNQPTHTRTDGFGTRIINISNYTPHLQQVLVDELSDLVCGFVEGRYSISNMNNAESCFIDLDDALVDCTPNEVGQASRFNCLGEYVPASFLEELAKRLVSTYEVEVSIVEGAAAGLLLKRSRPPKHL